MPDNSKLSPYLFTVEIDSIETARFQKCKGLEAETETFEFEEGGGHIIAQIFNGPGEQINYVPQAQTLNRGDWKAMENEWKEALNKIPPDEVKVDIQIIYGGESKRPNRFIVKYTIGGVKQKPKQFFNK
jgi:T4-like virus tail tube protein gp19.